VHKTSKSCEKKISDKENERKSIVRMGMKIDLSMVMRFAAMFCGVGLIISGFFGFFTLELKFVLTWIVSFYVMYVDICFRIQNKMSHSEDVLSSCSDLLEP
jgi:cytochrome c biogenesis protein CcdA